MNPGIYRALPSAEYHAIQAMSATGLKLMARSPAHYFGALLDPNRPPQEPTAAMKNGTLTHCATFEPEAVAERYVVRPVGLDGRTKEGKAWLQAQTLEVIDAEQLAAAVRQADALRRLPDVDGLLADGEAEVSVFWIDEETGELCKCRPDFTTPAGDGVILVDGKTTVDASPEGFGKAIWNFAYHLQAAHYSRGYEKATGKKVHGFVFAAVESSWPHAAAAYMLGDDVLEAAAAKCRRLMNLYSECKRTNNWPGYSAAIQQINLPPWAMKGIEA